MARASRELVKRPPALTNDWILGEISSGIDLGSVPTEQLTRGEQWKIWLDTGEKTKMDLIMELAKAPGKPPEGERIADAPVPFYEPGPVQTLAHGAIEKVVLVSGGKRAGKLAAINSRILVLRNGRAEWTTHGDVRIGDSVFNRYGVPVEVVNTERPYKWPIMKVTFDDDSEVLVAPEHEWVVDDAKSRKAEGREGSKDRNLIPKERRSANQKRRYLPQVLETQELAKNLHYTYYTSRGPGIGLNYSVDTAKPIELPERDLLVDPYVLGAWLGDGHKNIGDITGLDTEIFESIGDCGYKIVDRSEVKTKGIQSLTSQLRRLGVLNNKHIPNEYMLSSYSQRLALVQGLMDTDGTIDKRGRIEFCQTNERRVIADQLLRLLWSLGIKANMTEGPAIMYKDWEVVNCGIRYRIHFSTNLPVFRLSRKLQRVPAKRKPDTQRRFIRSIEPMGEQLGSCITVDSEDGLYLIGEQFIVSHQSKWLAANLLPYLFKSYAHVWIVGPNYELAHDEFNYIQMWLKWLNVPLAKDTSKPQQGGYSLTTKWNAVLESMTGKDEDQMEMVSLDAVGITEAGQTSRMLLDRLRGRVLQRRGRIFISGSPMASQAWYVNALRSYKNGDEHGDWHSYSIPSFDNKAVFPLGEMDDEIQSMKRNLPPEEYARMVLAEPMPPEGLVFKEFKTETHVVPITVKVVDPDKLAEAIQRAYSPFEDRFSQYPEPIMDSGGFNITGWEVPEFCDVELAIDPGWEHGYAVLACVVHKDNVLVIDEVYETQMYGEDVIQECKNRPWWPRVKKGVIDVASKQHHEGMSEHEKWRKYANLRLLTQMVPVPDGISRYRTFLVNPDNGRPRLFIDPKCDRYIWEHGAYKFQFHKEDRPIREVPIDANNHAIKAMTYFIVVRMGWTDKGALTTTSKRYIDRRPIRGGEVTDEHAWNREWYEGYN
jgi:intein/homing endonuclease